MDNDWTAWRCADEKLGEKMFCPPEGCPKAYGCAREHGWKPGDPSPRECMGFAPATND